MQDTSDSEHLEAAMNSSEYLVNYWSVKKVIRFVSYEDKFVPVYKLGPVFTDISFMSVWVFVQSKLKSFNIGPCDGNSMITFGLIGEGRKGSRVEVY